MDFYQQTEKEALVNLNTDKNGLTDKEATSRIKKYGLNLIEEKEKISPLKIFFSQFKDYVVYILLAALVISIIIPIYEKGLSLSFLDMLDAIVIFAILIINAVLGFVQEYKAEKSIELLRKLSSPKSKVIRNNEIKIIDSKELVPGDILILEEGDKISADARILEDIELQTNESALTGESTPVSKQITAIKQKVPIADQNNMVFSGTTATRGRAKAVVVNTGMQTELGKIATLVQTTGQIMTPLQKRLKILGKQLSIIVIIITVVIFSIGILRNIDSVSILLTALSIAVAAIPEGLPAVVTVTLALGTQRLLKRNSLIRKLKSVETLGSVKTICSDKTGTLTKGEMTAVEIFTDNKVITVTGSGYEIKGDFLYNDKKTNTKNFELLLKISASCNNATLKIGDPTEVALLVLAKKARIEREERIKELPFNSINKYMVTYHKKGNKKYAYLKGAPEKILGFSNYIKIGNKFFPLTKKYKDTILKTNEDMSSRALRVLATAYQEGKKTIFIGLIGMIDQPRREVKNAIKLCHEAGIRVIMITGDHLLTAEAIAAQIGIKGKSITGAELDKVSDEKLRKLVKEISIYARVNPEHKVKILEALQANKEIVAMTGDGVNDAPALKKANVGVAMSIKGTDISREASDMVLLDDNFSTIVNAVYEGRIIYNNIKKFVKYLLAANIGEVLIILFALLLNLPLPLLALQILWINLVTDGLPALALSTDNIEDKVMSKKPRDPKEGILKGSFGFIIASSILSLTVAGILYYLGAIFYPGQFSILNDVSQPNKIRTLILTGIVIFELFLVFATRTDKRILNKSLFSNKYLLLAIFSSVLLQILIIYTPLNIAFKLTPLNLKDWLLIIPLASLGLFVFELKRLFYGFANPATTA